MKKLLFISSILLTCVTGVFSQGYAEEETKQVAAVAIPEPYHYMAGISGSGSKIELEDGSLWSIRDHHWSKVRKWRGSDPIVVELNTKTHKKAYGFRLHNMRKDEYAMTNLLLGPYYDLAYWVAEIDAKAGLVALGDGTAWKIAPGHESTLATWYYNDTIMIGIDTTGTGKRNILINVNNMTYVSADCIAL